MYKEFNCDATPTYMVNVVEFMAWKTFKLHSPLTQTLLHCIAVSFFASFKCIYVIYIHAPI
jgi:hypothetical protein